MGLMCLDRRDVSLDEHSVRLPTSHLPSQPGLPKPPERLHDLKGISVWEFITMWPNLYLSHLFLPLWHWENCFQSLGGSLAFLHPIHHESSLQRMDHFHACSPACLSAAFIGWMLPPCTTVVSLCLLQLPSAQAYITRDTGGQFFLLCSGITGIDCDGQWPVNAPFVQCSSIKHHVWPPERDVWSELRFVTKLHKLIRLWRRPSFEQNIFVQLFTIFKAPNAKLESKEKWIFLEMPSFPNLSRRRS